MDWIGAASQANWATVIISSGCSVIVALIAAGAARAGLKKTHLLQDQTEIVLRRLLEVGSPKYPQRLRSFTNLQARVPLTDEKLREALLRAGAIQCKRPGDGEILWGLTKYHPDKL
jgi:hypothetical protein